MPLTIQHYAMLARPLLYTSVTRGKRLVVLVGSKRALGIAVRNGNARRRRATQHPALPHSGSHRVTAIARSDLSERYQRS
jgi:ATP-dependent exoDNAse (exonuclease V) alpha subunit